MERLFDERYAAKGVVQKWEGVIEVLCHEQADNGNENKGNKCEMTL